MIKVRPRCFVMYQFGDYQISVCCYPQQRWDCILGDGFVHLMYKNVTMSISPEDFKNHWVVVEGKRSQIPGQMTVQDLLPR